MIRILAALIALIVIMDFTFVTWKLVDGAAALIPAIIGAVVTAVLCWRDAAASRRRRLLALCTCFLAACLAISLVLEIVRQRASAQALPQMVLLGVLCLATTKIAQNALVASRRRRERIGFHAYYQADGSDAPVFRLRDDKPLTVVSEAFAKDIYQPVGNPKENPLP